MDLEDPFRGCWDRYDRAITHRDEALKVWNEFVSHDDAYTVGLYMNKEREGVGRGTLKVWQDTTMPTLLPILFGEYFYNLRAALDYAVYATAIIDNGWKYRRPARASCSSPSARHPSPGALTRSVSPHSASGTGAGSNRYSRMWEGTIRRFGVSTG